MNRVQKQDTVDLLSGVFASSSIVVVLKNNGLDAKAFKQFRRGIRRADGVCRIAKNTLTKLSLESSAGRGYRDALCDVLVGPTIIAHTDQDDPQGFVKVLVESVKDNADHVELVAASFSDRAVDISELKELASLPSMDVLRAQLLAMFSAPMANILNLLQAPQNDLLLLLDAYIEKRKKEGDAE